MVTLHVLLSNRLPLRVHGADYVPWSARQLEGLCCRWAMGHQALMAFDQLCHVAPPGFQELGYVQGAIAHSLTVWKFANA